MNLACNWPVQRIGPDWRSRKPAPVRRLVESGLEKFRGKNWFAEIRDKFPFPFDAVPAEISWQLATRFGLASAVALVIGLGTLFVAASLAVLTAAAIRRRCRDGAA